VGVSIFIAVEINHLRSFRKVAKYTFRKKKSHSIFITRIQTDKGEDVAFD